MRRVRKVLIIGRGPGQVAGMVSLVCQQGFEAVGTTRDADAAARLAAGGVDAIVIGGGVEDVSRGTLAQIADGLGVRVIRGALAGKRPEDYVRDELVPQLRDAAR